MIKLTGSKKKGWVIEKSEIVLHVSLPTLMFITHEELLALKKLLQKIK